MLVRHSRRPAATGLAAALTVILAACGGTSSTTPTSSEHGGTATTRSVPSASAPSNPGNSPSGSADGSLAPIAGGVSQVKLTLDGNSCTLDHRAATAGPITFTVTNISAAGLTEIELLQDQRIVGEKENLAPGLGSVSFTATLDGGTYVMYCPGADQENQDFTVTGAAPTRGPSDVRALLADGTKGYGQFVETTLTDMTVAVDNLKTAVDSGNVSDARAKYALARPFYEKVESDVAGFVLPGSDPSDNHGNLDYLIDMRASNLDPAVGWTGFHAIERDLWDGSGKITAQTKKYAADLQTNVTKLVQLARTLDYQPEDLANGAAGLLEEVQNNKIKGEEEAFSHTDLADFNANVEGARQAFAFLKPGLAEIDPTLTATVAEKFDAVRAALNPYRDATQPGGFTLWTAELRASDAATLSKTVQALQDPLSKIAEKVATA